MSMGTSVHILASYILRRESGTEITSSQKTTSVILFPISKLLENYTEYNHV